MIKQETFQDIKAATFGMIADAKPMGEKARRELEDSIEEMVTAIVRVIGDPDDTNLAVLARLVKAVHGPLSIKETTLFAEEITTGNLIVMLLSKGLETIVVNERLLYAKEYMAINPRVYRDMQLGDINSPMFHADHLEERHVLCTHRTANLVINAGWAVETNLGHEAAKPFTDLTYDLGIISMIPEHMLEYMECASADEILAKLNSDKSLITVNVEEFAKQDMPEGMPKVINLAGLVEEEP